MNRHDFISNSYKKQIWVPFEIGHRVYLSDKYILGSRSLAARDIAALKAMVGEISSIPEYGKATVIWNNLAECEIGAHAMLFENVGIYNNDELREV